jgi:hypothetical protein
MAVDMMTSSRRELDEGRALSRQLGSADATNPVPFGPWLQGQLVANRERPAATTLEQSTSPDWHMGRWIATNEVQVRRWDEIEGLSGMFIAPSTSYRDTEGALEAIRHARERDVPLAGT